jgi:hypothetical protein
MTMTAAAPERRSPQTSTSPASLKVILLEKRTFVPEGGGGNS